MISMSYLENSVKSCPRAQLWPDKRGRTVADCRGRSGRAIGLIFRSTAALREGARKLAHRLAAVIVAVGVNRDGRREVLWDDRSSRPSGRSSGASAVCAALFPMPMRGSRHPLPKYCIEPGNAALHAQRARRSNDHCRRPLGGGNKCLAQSSGLHRRASAMGKQASSDTPRSGRGGRRFKSCHSDQHLAFFQDLTGTDCGTETRAVMVCGQYSTQRV